jgi:hypothetical protein
MAIWNMIARLTMDSTAFDRNSKNAQKSMRGLMAESLNLQKAVLSLGGTYLGARGIVAGLRSVTQAAMAQQKAESDLRASLARTGDATSGNMAAFQSYASEIQKLTTYSDEQILAQMAYAHNIGVATDQLDEATVAAIGLARAYNKDLATAYRLVSLASKGETGQLKEMGIVIDKNLSPRGKYNELIRQGTAAFRLETEYVKTASGAQAQMNNTWGDTKEILGNALLPAAQTAFQNLNNWLQSNQSAIKRWSSDFVEGVSIARDALASINDFMDQRPKDIRSRFDALPKTMQESIQQSYQSQTGFKFGYHDLTAQGMMGGAMLPDQFVYPSDEQYARDLLAAYERQAGRQQNQGLNDRVNALGNEPMPTLTVTSSQQMTFGGDGGSELDTASTKTLDVAAAYRRMYQDMNEKSATSWKIRKELLVEEFEEYNRAIGNHIAVWEWFQEQMTDLSIEEAKASDNFFAGWSAGIQEMERNLDTLGQLGADLAQEFRNGMVDSLADAIMEAKDLGDALRDVGRSMARMALEWSLNQMVTSAMGGFTGGLGSLFGGGRAGGGRVSPGSGYLVGETGPEWFAPDTGGRIMPSAQSSPNMKVEVHYHGESRRVRTQPPQFDGSAWVTKVFLDDMDHGGPISERLGR